VLTEAYATPRRFATVVRLRRAR